jgi:hypothetical protein
LNYFNSIFTFLAFNFPIFLGILPIVSSNNFMNIFILKYFSGDTGTPSGPTGSNLRPKDIQRLISTWRYNTDRPFQDSTLVGELNGPPISVLLLSFGEGESTCFGSSHNHYRRAIIQGGLPVAPTNQFHNSYIFAGKIWPSDITVYHLDFKNGRFAFGPAGERVSPNAGFIQAAARIFGHQTPKFKHVAFLGGRADYQWLYNSANHSHPLPATAFLPPHSEVPSRGVIRDMLATTIPVLFNYRFREFQINWSRVCPDLVVSYLGTGQRSQHGPPHPQNNILDLNRMPSDFSRYSDSSFRNLFEYLRAVEANQRRQGGLDAGKVLYTVVSDLYFDAVSVDGLPANYRLEAFCFEILFAVLRGVG